MKLFDSGVDFESQKGQGDSKVSMEFYLRFLHNISTYI